MQNICTLGPIKDFLKGIGTAHEMLSMELNRRLDFYSSDP